MRRSCTASGGRRRRGRGTTKGLAKGGRVCGGPAGGALQLLRGSELSVHSAASAFVKINLTEKVCSYSQQKF